MPAPHPSTSTSTSTPSSPLPSPIALTDMSHAHPHSGSTRSLRQHTGQQRGSSRLQRLRDLQRPRSQSPGSGSGSSSPGLRASTSALAGEHETERLISHETDQDGDEQGDDQATTLLRGQGQVGGQYDQGWHQDAKPAVPASNAPQTFQGNRSKWHPLSWLLPSANPGKPRSMPFHAPDKAKNKFPANIVRNQKYNLSTFLPLVLYEQFKSFLNLYFLLVALSQIIPALRIGYLATYIVPLAFVLLVTLGKEAYDDYQRFQRDRIANSTRYDILSPFHASHSHHVSSSAAAAVAAAAEDTEAQPQSGMAPLKSIPSSKLKVGDLVLIEKNQRVPADLVLLRTSDASGTCFIRTDQLDGETDWKLRVALEPTQALDGDARLLNVQGQVYAAAPTKDIHAFEGTLSIQTTPPTLFDADNDDDDEEEDEEEEEDVIVHGATDQQQQQYPITAENVLWSNTVLAAGSAVGFVVYTGAETRAVMNTSHPSTKIGLLDVEINKIAKILCAVTFALSVVMVALNGFRGLWYIYVFRFLILFSTIIPISLRVNLDMGKTVYAHQIEHDAEIPETIVRTSTLPEELGRVEYLLSDKTGTLTKNEMELRKLHMGTMSYGFDSMDEVGAQLTAALSTAASAPHDQQTFANNNNQQPAIPLTRGRRDMSSRVRDVVFALALCHNVTPVDNDDGTITYQASSPDEVAIVNWTDSVGLSLAARDRTMIQLRATNTGEETFTFDILEIFPFTSDTKRMGIVVRDRRSGELAFYQKGADVVMAKICQTNDWLEEECGNMAREGLRTLVVGRKRLTEESWTEFQQQYREARVSQEDRNEAMARAISGHLEQDLELLGVTGVEDKLQDDVKLSLELLRNAGIKIWMLTGDKIETATCIAISSKLVSRNQYIHQIAKLNSLTAARDEIDFISSKPECCLVIDGESLQFMMTENRDAFIKLATKLPAVVACRCSPTQKADVARLIRHYTRKRVCCIGDGGNDVSMIQAADVGVGIVGKEGKQASLAADFSILQFSHLSKLLCWHGRNSYKRSAKLAQFIVHRGLLVAVIQAVFSGIVYFAPVAIFQDWLAVGYATIYTMGPVFSLVLDTDINEDLALVYPELYKELTKGRSLSYKTFFNWVLVSVYQGGAIMVSSMLLFETDFVNIVAIAFTATILNELVMVAVEVTTWHPLMVAAEIGSFILYAVSMAFLPQYFDLNFVLSWRFFWKVAIIVGVSAFPLAIIKALKQRWSPESYAKLQSF